MSVAVDKIVVNVVVGIYKIEKIPIVFNLIKQALVIYFCRYAIVFVEQKGLERNRRMVGILCAMFA